MTLNDVLRKFRNDFTKDDLKEVARYEWDQAKYDPTAKTFSDFLNRLKFIGNVEVVGIKFCRSVVVLILSPEVFNKN